MLDKANHIDPDVWAVVLIALGILVALGNARNHDIALMLVGVGAAVFKGQRSGQG